MRLRVRLAGLLNTLDRVFAPECPDGCRQHPRRCSCSWLPPLPDEPLD